MGNNDHFENMFCKVSTINRYGRHSFAGRFGDRRSSSWLPLFLIQWYRCMIDTFPVHFIFKKRFVFICSCLPASSVCLLQQDTIGNTAAEHYTPKNILDVRSFARLNWSRRVWGCARATTRHSCPGLLWWTDPSLIAPFGISAEVTSQC